MKFHKYRLMNLLGVRTVADLTRYAVKDTAESQNLNGRVCLRP